jgi:hypothetical protein
MKNFTKLAALAVVMMGFSIGVNAQESATASATATIITPISITKTVDMNFGNLAVQSTTGGTVILAPVAGITGRTKTGGVTLPATPGTVSAAAFTINGQADYTYAITLPTTDVILTSGTPADDMIINAFTSTPDATGTLTLGTETLYVGGTLTLAAAQTAGTYTTALLPFTVTVNYN